MSVPEHELLDDDELEFLQIVRSIKDPIKIAKVRDVLAYFLEISRTEQITGDKDDTSTDR